MKKITFIILLFIAVLPGHSQVAPLWVKIAAPSNVQNFDVQEVATAVDTSGNVYTAGSMIDTVADRSKVVLVKYNSAGAQQWIKYYDSSDPSYNGSYAVALLVDKSGNSYVCGYGKHNNTNSKDFMVIKYDNTGFQIWVQYWDGGQQAADYPTCATFDAAGNIIVAGYANAFGTTGNDMAIVKWGISGTQMWSYQYNNTAANGEDRALAVTSDKNNNIFITGSSYGTNARDMISIKVDASGVNQWTKRVTHATSGSDERGRSLIADSLGNCYVTGTTNTWLTIKYDPTGNVLWTNSYNTNPYNDSFKKIMLDKHNNPVVAGDAFFSGNNFSNLVVNKLNTVNGNSLWSAFYNYGGIDSFMDAAMDTSGNIYLCGKFEGTLGTDMSSSILNSSGVSLSTAVYSNPFHTIGADIPYSMAVDKNKNVILAGVAETRGNSSQNSVDIITLKFSTLVTGIAERSKEAIYMSIFPNPSNGIINIKINDAELLGALVTITNISGQIIALEKLSAFNQSITLSKDFKGIYFVTINHQKGSVTKKLVVE